MKYTIEMVSGGMIYSYIPSFMKVGRHVEGMLRFHLSTLKDCNVGITDGKDL
jgi:hypothetical protein